MRGAGRGARVGGWLRCAKLCLGTQSAGLVLALSVLFAPLPGDAGVAGVGCAGDCNGDGRVTIGELLTAVRIALGEAPVSDCSAADDNGDERISVGELVRAVAAASTGCPVSPAASPTPISDPTPTSVPLYRICGCVDELPEVVGGCGERNFTVTLEPLGRSTEPEFQTSVFCFESVPVGDYTLAFAPTCNEFGCWPDHVAVSVRDREVAVFVPTAPLPAP